MAEADLKDPKTRQSLPRRFSIFYDMDHGTAASQVPNLLVSRSTAPQIISFDPATLAAATKLRLQ